MSLKTCPPGADNISYDMSSSCYSIFFIFDACQKLLFAFMQVYFPIVSKLAGVVSIPKMSFRESNFHSISLIPIMLKILEVILQFSWNRIYAKLHSGILVMILSRLQMLEWRRFQFSVISLLDSFDHDIFLSLSHFVGLKNDELVLIASYLRDIDPKVFLRWY